MKNRKLTNILLGSLLPIVIMPSAIAIGIIANKSPKEIGFYYKDEYFENISEFENNIKDKITNKFEYDRKKIYYAKNIDKIFDSELNLNKYLYENIQSYDISLTKQSSLYKNNLNLPLTYSELNEIDFNNLDKNIRIYLGKNNIAYSSEKEAKLSYIN